MTQPKRLLKDVRFDFAKSETKCGPHIAYTLEAQGFAASGHNDAYMFKADGVEMTEEVLKNLEQVQLKISMEDFLEKFMGLWNCRHREVLTKLMGLETESEYALRTDEDLDEWDKDWLERRVEGTEEELTRFQVLKSAQEGEELSLEAQIELFNIRKQYESSYEGLVEDIEKALEQEPDVDKETQVSESNKSSGAVSEVDDKQSADDGITKNKGDTNVSDEKTIDVTELLKSNEAQELLKTLTAQAVAEATADNQKTIESLQKSNEALEGERIDRIKKGFTKGVESLSFVAEEDRTELVKGLVENHNNELVVKMFKLLADAQDEITVTKAEFATTEHGTDGEVTSEVEVDKSVTDLEADLEARFGNQDFL